MKSSRIGVIIKITCLLLFSPLSLFGQDEDTLTIDSLQIEEETIPKSPFNSYFEPLSFQEVEKVKEGWNFNGVYQEVSQIPDPKEIDGGYVSNPHNILQAAGVDTLNRIIKMVEDSTGSQFAVAVLNSIGDNDPHMFATDLFNHWGVGSGQANNGLLIMVVLDIRKASIITGYGMESIITDLETAEVRENEMVPFFKKDDYTTGVIRGVQVFAEMVYGVDPYYLQYDYSTDYSSPLYEYEEEEEPSTPFFERGFVRLYLIIAGSLTIIWFFCFVSAFFIKDLHKRYHFVRPCTLVLFPIVFPLPFLLLFFVTKGFMTKWRNTERFSHQSGEFMIKLDESADDEFLKKGQITEEKIQSIDYDVWVTPDRSEILVLAYKRWFSKYRKCPKCKYKTWYKKYDKVITAATYSSSGTGQRKFECKSCKHSKVTTYTIPRKTESSSSSGGYSSSGSSYSGGSSYSSSSSSSSWGGGSSGGGGSTGGW